MDQNNNHPNKPPQDDSKKPKGNLLVTLIISVVIGVVISVFLWVLFYKLFNITLP